MQIKANSKEEIKPSNLLKILLFWSTFLLIIFLGRKIFGSQEGNVDFIVKNLLSFGSAIILSGLLLHYLSVKSLKLSLMVIWFLIILLFVI
jgi:hypothetical protein